MNEFKLGGIPVGLSNQPFIIAEMSGNHNQSFDRAMKIVEAAADAGAHALKLQTYTADTMTLNIEQMDFYIDDKKSLWKGAGLYELYQKAYTPWEWHKPLMKKANELGLVCFSTPFDETAVDFLEDLEVPAYKIASFENTDLRLIRKVAATGKPVIISTGMATIADLGETVSALYEYGGGNFVLLKCTSTYPASPKESNVNTIPHLREMFRCEVGLSDHTMGVGVAVAAVAKGATVIEKHFTLSRADGGVDSSFSLEPAEMESLVVETHRAWQALGRVKYGIERSEESSIQFKRSLYITKDVRAGEKFTTNNIRSIRPGMGLPPKYYECLLGKSAAKDIKKGTPMKWDLIK